MSEITGITGISDQTSLDSSQSLSVGSDELNKDTFLTLLTTQMQNQDPLNPMANEEFVAQLATFSSLEQLMSANDMLANMYMGIASLNNSSMANLVGTEVVAVGDSFHYDGSGTEELHFEAAAETVSTTVEIMDENGTVIYTEDIGGVNMGEGSWTWDGTDQDGNPAPEGDYTFKITGTNVDGESVDIQEYIVGVIDEMDYSTGNPQPSIDGIRIDIGDILRLKDSTAEDADEDEEQSESQVESLSAAESQLESEVSTDEMSMSTLF